MAYPAALVPARRPKTAPFIKPEPPGIIVEERTAGDFSGREKPANHVAAGILDFALFGDADAAERNVMPQVTGKA